MITLIFVILLHFFRVEQFSFLLIFLHVIISDVPAAVQDELYAKMHHLQFVGVDFKIPFLLTGFFISMSCN